MAYNFPPFTIVFFIAIIVDLLCIGVLWQRRSSPGAYPLIFLLIAIGLWLFGRIFEAGGVDFNVKVFWGQFEYIGIPWVGTLWLFFTLDFSGHRWWRKKRYLFLLLIIPLTTAILAWTNQWHGLVWPRIYIPEDTFESVMIWEHGPIFWVHAISTYLLMAVGIFVLLRHVIVNRTNSRWQILLLLLGTTVPIVANFIYLSGNSPVKGLDLTPLAFMLSAVPYSIVLFGFRFMNIVPVARSLLVYNMPEGMVVLNNSGIIIDMNPAAAQMLNITTETAVNKSLDKIWSHLNLIRLQLQSGQHTEIAFEKNKERRYLDISTAFLKDEDNHISGQMIMLDDITERRMMEQTLRESEIRYSTLVEQSGDGIIIIQNGAYKFANQTLSDMTGYSVNEFMNESIPFGVEESEKEHVIAVNRARESGESAPSVYETKLQCKDGKVLDVEISVNQIIYEGMVAHIATLRDITERKITRMKLEALYNKEHSLREELQDEISNRTKYTRAMVHELKTPLTAILASSELLETEVIDTTLAALVKNIRRASLNLEQRINELLELARGETGMLTANLMPSNLITLIQEVVSEIKPVAEAKGLTLEMEIEDIPLVLADISRIRQVLNNLLSNAIKFTSSGRIKIKTGIYDAGHVLVQVQDTGRGISAEEMEFLFDPYRRKVHEGKQLGGLGIGLALCKIFIDLHKSKMWAESELGRGSTFYFTLPLYHESLDPE